MAQLIILVLNDPDKTGEVLEAWLTAGVSGATILESTGLRQQLARMGPRDDLPLIPSLSSLLRSREEHHRTLWVVVADDFDVERLVRLTEEQSGRLDDPHTGILFVVPVTRVWGLQLPWENPGSDQEEATNKGD